MAQVPEKVLAWLYSVLHEYQDPQRTYSDAARTLSAYPSLSPRTEVYTHENGSSALLLTLSGTLPVSFRGTAYRFPMKLWVPHSYPQEAPFVYVTPGRDMLTRPGQHVGVDGRVYHPYLRDWSSMWDRASITEFLEYLQQVFAKEPPIISKAQQQQYYNRPVPPTSQPQMTPGASPAPPQWPPKQRMGSVEPVEMPSGSTPPPKPPKPGEEYAQQAFPQRTSSRNVTRDGPPLPPLPHEQQQQRQQYAPSPQYQNGYSVSPRPMSHAPPSQQPPGYQNGRPPGPPMPSAAAQSSPYVQHHHQQMRSNSNRSPVSPVSPINGYAAPVEKRYSQPAPLPPQQAQQQPQQYQQIPQQQYAQQHSMPPRSHPQHHPQQPQKQPQLYPPNQYYMPQPQPQPPQPRMQPPPDLLSDPFDVALTGPNAQEPPAPAPPIPPNPEKEHLLHALSQSLVQQAQAKVSQNLSAVAPLQAQQTALRTAHQQLEAEIRQLEALSQTLDSNEAILRRSIQDCDHLIQSTRSKPQPNIDEVLVAPTVVAQQLWNCCAEEAACREAMYVLQKAVDRGRVSGSDFVRQMRALGREAFGKMVLARKCAAGLGLDLGGKGVGVGY